MGIDFETETLASTEVVGSLDANFCTGINGTFVLASGLGVAEAVESDILLPLSLDNTISCASILEIGS